MCTGVEIALLASTGLAAGSAIVAGQQHKEVAKYEAAQHKADADTEKQAGEIRAEKIRERARAQAASARAALAGSGVSVDSVTANLINQETIQAGELDALTTQNDSLDAATRLRNQARVDVMKGKQAEVAGYVGAASSALGSYSQYKAGWYGGS